MRYAAHQEEKRRNAHRLGSDRRLRRRIAALVDLRRLKGCYMYAHAAAAAAPAICTPVRDTKARLSVLKATRGRARQKLQGTRSTTSLNLDSAILQGDEEVACSVPED